MMRRRELMGMQGVLKTVSGPIVTVNDALPRNAKSLVVNFAPIQAAGTPAPDNVLPISGWTGVTAYVGPTAQQADATTYTVDWTDEAGTVYGGYVDLVSGVLTVTHKIVDLGGLGWSRMTTYAVPLFVAQVTAMKKNSVTVCDSFVCYKNKNFAMLEDNAVDTIPSNNFLYIRCDTYSDDDLFKTAMNGVQLVYELATPITYQLTPQTIAMLRGTNNVWSNANGNIELTYYAQ